MIQVDWTAHERDLVTATRSPTVRDLSWTLMSRYEKIGAMAARPGWYPDPDPNATGQERWFDGTNWAPQAPREPTRPPEPVRAPQAAPVPMPQQAALHPVLVNLPPAIRNHAAQALVPGEQLHFSLNGAMKEALLATQHRCLIVKTGWMTGNAFGGRVTSFQYADIQAVQTRFGITGMGYLEIVTAGFPSMERNYWSSASGQRGASARKNGGPDKNADPSHAPNCLSGSKRMFAAYQPYLAQLEALVRTARNPSAAQPAQQAGADMASQLAQLAALHQAGALTTAEFTAAKARLLR